MTNTKKIKKVQIVRPEVDIEFVKPILGRLYFFTIIPKLLMIKKGEIHIYHDSMLLPGCAGHMETRKIWFICVPKIRFGVVNGDET